MRHTLAAPAVAIILSVAALAACGSEPGDQTPPASENRSPLVPRRSARPPSKPSRPGARFPPLTSIRTSPTQRPSRRSQHGWKTRSPQRSRPGSMVRRRWAILRRPNRRGATCCQQSTRSSTSMPIKSGRRRAAIPRASPRLRMAFTPSSPNWSVRPQRQACQRAPRCTSKQPKCHDRTDDPRRSKRAVIARRSSSPEVAKFDPDLLKGHAERASGPCAGRKLTQQ